MCKSTLSSLDYLQPSGIARVVGSQWPPAAGPWLWTGLWCRCCLSSRSHWSWGTLWSCNFNFTVTQSQYNFTTHPVWSWNRLKRLMRVVTSAKALLAKKFLLAKSACGYEIHNLNNRINRLKGFSWARVRHLRVIELALDIAGRARLINLTLEVRRFPPD